MLTFAAMKAGSHRTFHLPAAVMCIGLAAPPSLAEDNGRVDHSVVLEIGPAGEWPLGREHANYGGMLAAEITPIENWLELEFGITAQGASGKSELSADLLFKKPFRISPTFEQEIGGQLR